MERRACGDAIRSAVELLTASFADDPVVRWFGLDVDAELFRPAVEAAAASGELDIEAPTAVAVWQTVRGRDTASPPAELPERLRVYLARTAARAPRRHPYLHLHFLGVHPDHRRRGAGGRLLARGLATADSRGMPAYLEASAPGNVRLYERHGFRRFGADIPLPGGPMLTPMWRPCPVAP